MDFCSTSSSNFKSSVKLKHKLNSEAKSKEVGVSTDPLRPRICQLNKLPYAHHYNPRFVYFLPTFTRPFLCFQGDFFRKFCPYVWLVLKSGFWSRAGVRYLWFGIKKNPLFFWFDPLPGNILLLFWKILRHHKFVLKLSDL